MSNFFSRLVKVIQCSRTKVKDGPPCTFISQHVIESSVVVTKSLLSLSLPSPL